MTNKFVAHSCARLRGKNDVENHCWNELMLNDDNGNDENDVDTHENNDMEKHGM